MITECAFKQTLKSHCHVMGHKKINLEIIMIMNEVQLYGGRLSSCNLGSCLVLDGSEIPSVPL